MMSYKILKIDHSRYLEVFARYVNAEGLSIRLDKLYPPLPWSDMICTFFSAISIFQKCNNVCKFSYLIRSKVDPLCCHYICIKMVLHSKYSSCFLRSPQKSTKSSPSIWHYVVSVKLMVNISSIFAGLLENTNFNDNSFLLISSVKKIAMGLQTRPIIIQIKRPILYIGCGNQPQFILNVK